RSEPRRPAGRQRCDGESDRRATPEKRRTLQACGRFLSVWASGRDKIAPFCLSPAACRRFFSVQKILIVRVSSLGDVVHNMPVIADIRRRHPDAQIDWLVEESFVDLVKLVDGVRNVLPFSLRRWRKKPFSGATWREIRAFRRRLAAEQYDL